MTQFIEAYRACKTYRDTGAVESRTRVERNMHLTTATFATTFVRGKGFSFEYRALDEDGDEERFALRHNGSATFQWSFDGPWRVVKSLPVAIASLGGVTIGVATNAPGLLVRGAVRAPVAYDFPACAERIEDRSLDGRMAYQFRCVDYDNIVTTIVLEKKTLVLRIIEEWEDGSHHQAVPSHIVTYNAELNAPIVLADLASVPSDLSDPDPP